MTGARATKLTVNQQVFGGKRMSLSLRGALRFVRREKRSL
jgi:hypothetical protein